MFLRCFCTFVRYEDRCKGYERELESLKNPEGLAQRAAQATQDRVAFAERRCTFWKKKAASENKILVNTRSLVTTLRAENNKHIDCIRAFEKREQDGRYSSPFIFCLC